MQSIRYAYVTGNHIYVHNYYPRTCLTFSQSQGSLTAAVGHIILGSRLVNERQRYILPNYVGLIKMLAVNVLKLYY